MQFSDAPIKPSQGFLRLYNIIGCRKRNIPPLLPVSRSVFFKRVAEGIYPPGVLQGKRMRIWSIESINQLLEDLREQEVDGSKRKAAQ
jgi:prophage regulatory protein